MTTQNKAGRSADKKGDISNIDFTLAQKNLNMIYSPNVVKIKQKIIRL